MTDTAGPRIGLALSGGGARAIAFHLGCLRALNRLGLLDQLTVVSTVSGGSVIGAYWHAHQGDFSSFETKMRQILAEGLVRTMRNKLFGLLGVKVFAAFVTVGCISITISLRKSVTRAAQRFVRSRNATEFCSTSQSSPLRRFASRTSLLEAALDELLFQGVLLKDLPDKPHLVINATELRTGSAFRFGTKESGSWRWGRIRSNATTVAHAVAASAAYPLLLPAFDETLTFESGGEAKDVRVNLTDGGIYDNLGLGCLWPERSEGISLNVFPVDTIICCSAGYGLRQEPPTQFFVARMFSAFTTVFDRAQNASIHRLHDAQRSGKIRSFILPYLGQLDRALPNPPADLVRREDAHSYPTDFNPMAAEWIDRLSLRGEQLTLCLAQAYIPELIIQQSRSAQ